MKEPRSASRRDSGWRVLVPGLLLLLGTVIVLSALRRIAWVIHASSLDVRPDGYAGHLWVTAFHLIPGLAFTLLGPFQFSAAIRRRAPQWHRWSGRVVVVSGLCAALSSLWMNEFDPGLGGLLKYCANLSFGLAQIGALSAAVLAISRRQIARHRAWMVRAFALGLGVSTLRLYLIPLSLIYGQLSDVAVGLVMWAGWGTNVLVAELILLRQTRAMLRTAPVQV